VQARVGHRVTVRTFEAWRDVARRLIAAGVAPADVTWDDPQAPSLFGDALTALPEVAAKGTLRLSRDLIERLAACACHRDPQRWGLMYRIVWRVSRGETALGGIASDPDIRSLDERARSVRRDCHKMTAFVRFRAVHPAPEPAGAADAGETRYVAWFEPEHHILRRVATFFVDRFAGMHWTIVTPDGAMCWDGRALGFLDDAASIALPDADPTEGLWRTYYRSIFNPARLNVATMTREMPRRYWRNLPEAEDIAHLAIEAPARAAAFVAATPAPRRAVVARGRCGGAPTDAATLPALHAAIDACRRCPLHAAATQAVCGAGPTSARIMLVGEQPGDAEDLAGAPFVGPAGRLLDRLLAEAGLDRDALFLTNAVKHFKWTPRGKRRIHKTPAQAEVAACIDWLEREIEIVKPTVILALGATALGALAGARTSLASVAGRTLRHASGATLLATWHPAAILRAASPEDQTMRADLVAQLAHAGRIASSAAAAHPTAVNAD
jgi:DNA polymerase